VNVIALCLTDVILIHLSQISVLNSC